MDGCLEVKAAAGDPHLSGKDFDKRIDDADYGSGVLRLRVALR